MATYVIYAGASDGRIFSSNATYATARSGSGLTAADTNVNDLDVGQVFLGGTYYIYEGFLQFDTSGVSGSPVAATLSLYGNVDNSGVDFTLNARAHDWGAAIDTADWVAGASLSAKALRASRSTSGLTTSGYNDFTSDSSFVSNLTSPVRLVLSSSRHEAGTTPASSAGGDATDERVFFQATDTTGTTQDPKLTVQTVDATGDTGTGTDASTSGILVRPSATTVVYADAADGFLTSYHASTYATARSGGTLTADDAGALAVAGQINLNIGTAGYYAYESFLSFDTGAIAGTPLLAALAIYGYLDSSGVDFTINARAVDWGASLATGDWVAGASLTGNPLRASLNTAGFSTSGYNTFSSDSSFAGNLTNPVRLLLSSSRLEAGTAPASSGTGDANDERVFFQTADTSGTTQDPKLTITAAAATETGSGSESGSLDTGSVTKTASDTGSGTDASLAVIVTPYSDDAGGPFGIPAGTLVTPWDSGTGTEGSAVTIGIGSVAKAASDTATGVDTSAGIAVTIRKAGSDTGVGVDSSGTSTSVDPVKYTMPMSANFVSARSHTAQFVSARSQTADFIPSPSTVT